MVLSGALAGVSIGFIGDESKPLQGGGVKFTRATLLEISLVPVQANRDALVTAKNFKGNAMAPCPGQRRAISC